MYRGGQVSYYNVICTRICPNIETHLGEYTMNFTQVICLNKLVCVPPFFHYLYICTFNQLDVELYKSSSYATFQVVKLPESVVSQ